MDSATPEPHATSPVSTASSSDLAGETFGDFRILRLLGQGGMGRVYLAEQISLKRKVAVKFLREDIAANPTALARFKAESKTVAKLSHANIVQVYMVGEHEGRHYMVLEYVEGKSLRDYLLRTGPLDVPLVLSLMRKVASALYCAAQMGVVHRDLKPENILLTRKAEAKVADFGLARCLEMEQAADLTRSGTTVGTPLYMSPEQVEGKVVDARSDIYSFGVTCYHMLVGRTPFTGSHAFEIAVKHVRDEPPRLETLRPDLPPALCAVVRKMMAKDPQARYQSARELLKDIARVRDAVSEATGSMAVGAITKAPASAAATGIARGATGSMAVGAVTAEALPPADSSPSAPVPIWKRPVAWLWVAAALALGLLILVGAGTAIAVVWYRSTIRPEAAAVTPPAPPPGPPVPAAPPAGADGAPPDNAQREQEEALKKRVEQDLKDNLPNPAGVDDCIDLGVLYLEQHKDADAEGLFARMAERQTPPAYHFVGLLGLAVTDAVKNDEAAAHEKFKELYDSKNRDDRVKVLNDYLAKKPKFAGWVNEADTQNVRKDASQPSKTDHSHHFPFNWPPRKP